MTNRHSFHQTHPTLHGIGRIIRRLCLFGLTIFVSWSGCLQESPRPSAEQTVAILVALLQDHSAEVRRTAVESLGKIGDRSTVSSVLPLLTDSSPLVRSAAAKTVGLIGSDRMGEVIPRLFSALEDQDDAVRQAAAQAIGELDPPADLLSAFPTLLTSPDVRIRRVAIQALLSIDSTQLSEVLQRSLRDADAVVRQGAVAILGDAGLPSLLPWIEERATQDPDPAVRAEAVYRMGKMVDTRGRGLLQRIAETDSDRSVRRWAQAEVNSKRGND